MCQASTTPLLHLYLTSYEVPNPVYSTKGLSSHPNATRRYVTSSTCDVLQNYAQNILNIAHQTAVSILFLEFHAIYSKVVWYKSAKPKVIEEGLVKQCQMVFYIICLVTVKSTKVWETLVWSSNYLTLGACIQRGLCLY